MRFAVFVFSVLLIFSTTYAYAVAWVPAAVGGIVNMGGKFLKVANKKGLLGHSATWVAGYCTANKKKCLEALGEVGDLAEDWLEEDQESDYSGLVFVTNQGGPRASFNNPSDMCKHSLSNVYTQTTYVNVDDHWVYDKGTKDYKAGDYVVCKGDVKFLGGALNAHGISSDGWVEAKQPNEDTKDKEQQKQEQIQKIINNLSDTEINTIINNYSTEIDIDKYCNESGSCDELSKEFGDEVTKNQNKYDIDKINKANCLVENGKIVSCDNAKLEIEEENEETDTSTDEDEKTFCDTSDLTKEICEYLDWVDDEPEEKEDQKVEVEDEEEKPLDDDIIDVDKTCPPPEEIHITMPWGYATTVVFDYKPYCDFAEKINPYMVATGGLMAMYTVAGVRRF